MAKETEDESLDNLLGQLMNLMKTATDDSPNEDSAGSAAPTEPDMSADGAPAPGGAPAGPPPEASADPAAAGAPPDAGAAPGAEGTIDPAPTVEGLTAEYNQLPDEDLRMHFLAAKTALTARMGQGAGAPPGADPAAAGGPPAAPPAPPELSGSAPAPTMKSENLGLAAQALKLAQAEMAELRKSFQEQQALNEKLMSEVVEVMSMPIRKSVTRITDVKPAPPPKKSPENMSRDEARVVLEEKSRAQKLTKSDRKQVTEFYLGHLTTKQIAHLLGE